MASTNSAGNGIVSYERIKEFMHAKAKSGHGIYVLIAHVKDRAALYACTDHVWSEEDKAAFNSDPDTAMKTMKKHLKPDSASGLIHALNSLRKDTANKLDETENFLYSGLDLEEFADSKFARLYLFDNIEPQTGAHMLIPSEFIDRTAMLAHWSKILGAPVKSARHFKKAWVKKHGVGAKRQADEHLTIDVRYYIKDPFVLHKSTHKGDVHPHDGDATSSEVHGNTHNLAKQPRKVQEEAATCEKKLADLELADDTADAR